MLSLVIYHTCLGATLPANRRAYFNFWHKKYYSPTLMYKINLYTHYFNFNIGHGTKKILGDRKCTIYDRGFNIIIGLKLSLLINIGYSNIKKNRSPYLYIRGAPHSKHYIMLNFIFL